MIWAVAAAWAVPVATEELVGRALQRDPDVTAAEAELEAARGARAAAGFLRANPSIEASGGLGIPQAELSAMQPLSLSGEGGAARRQAEARTRAAEHALVRARLEAAAEARLALCNAIASSRDAQLARAAVDRARGLREAVEAQVAVGDAPEVDAQLARLAEAAAVGEWLAAVHTRDQTRVTVLAATGLPADTELPEDPLQAAPAQGNPAEVRTDVLAAEASVEAAREAIRRENAAAVPPLGVGVWAQWQNVAVGPGPTVPPWEPGNVGVTVGPAISMEVPLWHRNEAGRAQARGELAEATTGAELARSTAEAEQRTIEARRAEIESVLGAMPELQSSDADAAVISIEKAYTEGQLSGLEVTVWLDRIGAAERAVVSARREAAEQRIEQALTEEWSTLLGSTP
jgi:cobalt-zinc-cadmium efflux system outer membrane protein